jgi:hypothetical protein
MNGIQIASASHDVLAVFVDGTYLGGARRAYAIGSRGQRPWWTVQVGGVTTEVNNKADARIELRRLAASILGEMPAISVRLPWAWALRTWLPGAKRVENRGKRIPPQYVGHQIAIHASGGWDRDGAADQRIRTLWYGRPEDDRGPLDATDFSYMFRKVIAVGTLADCHQAYAVNGVTCCPPWGQPHHSGKVAWHYVFTDMVRLPRPVAAVGSLLLPWSLPADLATLVRNQLEAGKVLARR